MKKLLKLGILITIAQLSCLKCWCQSEVASYTSSTGGCYMTTNYSDSVYISIDELKIANSKMAELKYKDEIIFNLRQRISNDDEIINNLSEELKSEANKVKQYKLRSYIATGVATICVILYIFK